MLGRAQSRIQGYMHNILSDTEYSQRMLPATPPRRAKSPPSPLSPRGRGSDAGRAIIDPDPPRSPRDAHRGHRSTSSSSGSRREALGRPRGDASAFRRGRHDLVRPALARDVATRCCCWARAHNCFHKGFCSVSAVGVWKRKGAVLQSPLWEGECSLLRGAAVQCLHGPRLLRARTEVT